MKQKYKPVFGDQPMPEGTTPGIWQRYLNYYNHSQDDELMDFDSWLNNSGS